MVIAAIALISGCSEPETTTLVAESLALRWKLVPHRLSDSVVVLSAPGSTGGWALAAREQGGSFGAVDRVLADVRYRAVAGSALTVLHGSATVTIPAGEHTATRTVEHELPAGASEGPVAVILRGFELSSDRYEKKPAWLDRYDPSNGYTSAGLGMRVHDARLSGRQLELQVSATAKLAPCDRADATKRDDMNGTVELASTWITVHYTAIVVPGGSVTRGQVDYFLDYPDFRKNGVAMKPAAGAQRAVTLEGEPGLAHALIGMSSFDFVANDPKSKSAACTIRASAECKGRGRYIRTIRWGAELSSYDPKSGRARAEADLLFSNSARDGVKQFEAGSMCARARGDVVLIQLGDDAEVSAPRTLTTPELKNGADDREAIDICALLADGCGS